MTFLASDACTAIAFVFGRSLRTFFFFFFFKNENCCYDNMCIYVRVCNCHELISQIYTCTLKYMGPATDTVFCFTRRTENLLEN